MKLTLGQAAKRLGLSKPTLSKHIKNGKLAAHKNEEGWFEIDAAELGRFEAAYKRVPVVAEETPAPYVTGVTPSASPEVELAEIRERARQLEERLAEARAAQAKAEEAAATARAEAAEAVAKEREAWQRVAGLLEGPRPEPRAGWWSRLLGR